MKSYLTLASGLTEVTRQRAVTAAKALVSQGEATAEQVTGLADDLLSTSRNNREAVLALVRFEVERALTRLGLATGEEVKHLQSKVTALESRVRELEKQAAAASASTTASSASAPTTSKAPVKAASTSPGKAPAKPAKSGAKSPAKRTSTSGTAGS